jgi:signal transduction histidine kinase
MPLIYAFSLFGFALSVLLVGFLALIKRQDETGVRFFIFCVDVFGWAILISLWISQIFSENTALWLTRFSHVFSATIPIVWLHFVMTFSNKKEPIRYFYAFFYTLAALLSISCLTPFFIPHMHPILEFRYYPSPGWAYHIFALVFFILVPIAFWQLISGLKVSTGPRRKQYQYFITAMIVAFSAGSSTFPPVYGISTLYGISTPLYFILVMIAFPFLMGFALIRYGLFDVQQIADAFQREKLAAIGTMAASLNHELRNPLYIAKGKIESYLDGAERGLYPSLEEKQQNAEKVLGVASLHLQRAMDIIQRFSDFARPYNDKRDKQRVMLRDIFHDVLELVSHEFEIQKVRLTQEPMDGLALHVNRRQLEEILFNLILNACHAMGEKGGELFLKARQSNGRMILEITDTGPGISEENQKQIFDPFFSTKGEKGSGLGLYITKQLVEKNGGKISVKSKLGKGTSFLLEFKS